MASGNNINIFRAPHFKFQASFRKVRNGDNPALGWVPLGDIIILTKNTTQVASAEKDCTGTAFSCNGLFFPKMQIRRGNSQLGTFPAETPLPG